MTLALIEPLLPIFYLLLQTRKAEEKEIGEEKFDPDELPSVSCVFIKYLYSSILHISTISWTLFSTFLENTCFENIVLPTIKYIYIRQSYIYSLSHGPFFLLFWKHMF